MYAATTSGWMLECTFFDWFTKMFTQHLLKVRDANGLTDTPAILFLDGHSSHISVRIVEHAMANNIKIIKFPSHLTDKLQPLDKCVFGPMKTSWEQLLVAHGRSRMGVGPSRLSKDQFSKLLRQVWLNINPANIIKGFSSTGLLPLDKYLRELV